MQMVRLRSTSLNYDDVKNKVSKDADMSPFESARRLLDSASVNLSIGERMDLVFQDADLVSASLSTPGKKCLVQLQHIVWCLWWWHIVRVPLQQASVYTLDAVDLSQCLLAPALLQFSRMLCPVPARASLPIAICCCAPWFCLCLCASIQPSPIH